MVILSTVCLLLGVIAYGISGTKLSEGANSNTNPLRSTAWWVGTASQGAGFFLTLIARQQLPLATVQAATVAAIVVTLAVEHITGRRRATRLGVIGSMAMVAAVSIIAVISPIGQVSPTSQWILPVIGLSLLFCVIGVVTGTAHFSRTITKVPPVVFGALSGLAFGTSAIAARILAAQTESSLFTPWSWTSIMWWSSAALVTAIVLGQTLVTRGLVSAHSVPTLAAMYLVGFIWPICFGWLLLDEQFVPGSYLVGIVAVVVAVVASLVLLRIENTPVANDRDNAP